MCPHQGLATTERQWTSTDVENQILRRDSKRFIAIFSSEWTFLDIRERLWMVGRVATTFSTQLIDFAKNKQFRFLRGP